MADGLDIDAMLSGYTKNDFMDFGMIGDANGTLDGGILTLTVHLRPSKD